MRHERTKPTSLTEYSGRFNLFGMHWLRHVSEPPILNILTGMLLATNVTQKCKSDWRIQTVEVVTRVLDVTQ